MLSSDIIEYQALDNGRCGTEVINSGAVAKLIKHVPTSLRTAGGIRRYCSHTKITNSDGAALLDPHCFQDKNTTSADDYVVQCLLPVDTAKADLETVMDTLDFYGSAELYADVLATASTLIAVVKHANMLPGGTHDIFRDGDDILITSNTDTVTEDGDEVIATISGTPTYSESTLQVTITLTDAIGTAFTAADGVRVTSLMYPGDVETSFDSVSADFGNDDGGTAVLDTGSYPPTMSNAGGVRQDWTIEFTDDAGSYSVTGDSLSGTWSGTTAADLTIANPNNSSSMLVLETGIFGNLTPVTGDKHYFSTYEATVYRGQLHYIAAGAEAVSGNSTDLSIVGDAEPTS